MNQKKNYVKPVISILLMVVIIAAMAVIYLQLKPQGKAGEKEITVDVVIPDQETEEFVLDTNEEFLRQALEDEGLIKGTDSEFGLYITEVNGRVVNDANQEWWCITKGGETVNYGVDQIAITDGDHYEITLTVGY
ncbi:MAG: hypothetical protein K0S76_2251 [Herbinix sp.]|jgi:hypothetical protein|nr:hypothetical protein [Herbinix sp.]